MTSQENGLSPLSVKWVYKVMLIAGLIVVGITAFLNYFFIHELAESRIRQVKEIADTTSAVVSELALVSFYDNNQDRMIKALHDSVSHLHANGGGFLQISVILYPSGVYYASSNRDFVNKRVGQSLFSKIKDNNVVQTSVEKLNYEFDNRSLPVLHFLRNIFIERNGEMERIAVTQILFDYSEIIKKTRQTLILVASACLVCLLAAIWMLYLPIKKLHRRLISGFVQISNKNFDYKLRTRDQGEIGVLFDTFNKMTFQLKSFFHERQQSKMNSVMSSIEGRAAGSKDLVLRKADITCLCARIPDIQSVIQDKSPETVAESISRFVDPFESVVKEYGGQIIKILGDKIYVLFEGINSIDNAIRTALKVNHQWQTINHERKVLNRKKLDYGIGLHSAEGVAGTLGHHSLNYTVVGKAASIAEYLCTIAKSEEILVSSSLMDKASGSFPHQVLDKVEPLNMGETEQVLIVTNLQYSEDHPINKNGTKRQGLANGSGMGIPNGFGGLTASSSGHDASIPDMLEETLSNAPLDPIAPSPPKKGKTKQGEEDQKQNGEKNNGPKQSLWDEFEK